MNGRTWMSHSHYEIPHSLGTKGSKHIYLYASSFSVLECFQKRHKHSLIMGKAFFTKLQPANISLFLIYEVEIFRMPEMDLNPVMPQIRNRFELDAFWEGFVSYIWEKEKWQPFLKVKKKYTTINSSLVNATVCPKKVEDSSLLEYYLYSSEYLSAN